MPRRSHTPPSLNWLVNKRARVDNELTRARTLAEETRRQVLSAQAQRRVLLANVPPRVAGKPRDWSSSRDLSSYRPSDDE
jgi:hypothetical protein